MRDLPFACEFAQPAALGAAGLRGLGEPLGAVVIFAECGLRIALGEQAAAGVVVCSVEQDGLGLAAQQQEAAVHLFGDVGVDGEHGGCAGK